MKNNSISFGWIVIIGFFLTIGAMSATCAISGNNGGSCNALESLMTGLGKIK